MQKGIEELKSHMTQAQGGGCRLSSAREGSKNSKVTQYKFCMVGIGRKRGNKKVKSHSIHVLGSGYRCF